MEFNRYSCKVISWLHTSICCTHLFKLQCGFMIMQCKILYFAKGFGDSPNLENKNEKGSTVVELSLVPPANELSTQVDLSLNVKYFRGSLDGEYFKTSTWALQILTTRGIRYLVSISKRAHTYYSNF
jgi:hypothetical protein